MSTPEALTESAPIFAALGDPTRLSLLTRLSEGGAQSISSLSTNRALTRQAVTKHLHVLEAAGLVTRRRIGRESRYSFRPEAMEGARSYLETVARQWSEALWRLKEFIEE